MRSGSGMVGPLTAFAPGFSAELVARGYRPRSAAAQMALMADVSRWLADHGLDERDLSEARVEELMAHRRVSGPATLLSSRAMVPLLEYLRSARRSR
jgi:integrase/recombinase XerD